MYERSPVRSAIISSLVCALALTLSQDALADARTEAAAKAAIKKAAADFAALNYGTGAGRLQKALRACGDTRCSSVLRGSLLMDLGAMQFKKGEKDLASKSWNDAVKLQPGIAFDPAFDQPDLRAAFAAATGGGGGGGPAPSGDFTHTPPTEQTENTPLPLYVEGGSDSVTRVVVKYRGESSMSWKRVDMKKMGSGWAALIPCGDVQSGTLRYYIQGLDESKTPVASNGDTKHPYQVQIKSSISGAAPHLPGKSAPKSCSVSSDCPPDFPGCAKSGESAGENGDENGEDNGDKGEGEEAAKPSGPFKRFWVGIAGELEFVSMPSGNDLCALDAQSALPSNKNNMYCTTLDGNDFPLRSSAVQNASLCTPNSPAGTCPGDGGGSSTGGIVRGDLRIMASFDYAITANLLAGARAGASIFTYPGQAAISDGRLPSFVSRFYGEVRGTWVFGDQALASPGLKPMVFGGLGLASFEAHKSAFVGLCGANGSNVSGGVTQNTSGSPMPGGQCVNSSGVDSKGNNNYTSPTTGSVNVWALDGPFFVLLGAGARWAVTDSIALTGALRLNAAFGASGLLPTFGPELGAQYGF